MKLFRNVSLKRKQTLIILLTSGVALLLACAGFVTYELVTFRRDAVRNLSTLAEVIANNSTGAVDFNDPKGAEETLAALKAEPSVHCAVVYTQDGKVFATYHRADADGVELVPPPVRPAGYTFNGPHLEMFQPIVRKGDAIGSVYVEADLSALYSRFKQYALIVLGVFSAASLVAFLLSTWLQRVISAPILHLVQTARSVAENKNFSLRATKQSEDELGVLVDGFNEMLRQIQHRDAELQKANDELEARVLDRTGELQQEIIERQRSEQALRISEERFRSVWERSIEGMRLTDREGRIVAVNEAFCKLVRLPREELVGAPFSVTYAGHGADDGLDAYTRRFDNEEIVPRIDARVKLWNGDEADMEVSSSFVESEQQDKLVLSIFRDVTARKQAEAELDRANKQLLETSRRAGMAEVATGVLHNVGNVLNSVNVSATLVSDTVKKARCANLGRVAALLNEHGADLGGFFTNDPRSKELPRYLTQLADHLGASQSSMLAELESLRKNIEHIKDIVAMQQSYAKVAGVTEVVKVTDLVEDTLRLNAAALVRHRVKVIRDYAEVPALPVEKHKVLQILVNLVRNAKYACDESGRADKELIVSVTNGDGRVRISVADNGVGIPPENLTRIFNHGFTTRKEGHGFGLHSGALAAKEMGGALHVHSDGPGKGARFTLELPCQKN